MKIECTEWEYKMICKTLLEDMHCFFEAKDCCGDCEMCIQDNIEWIINVEE